MITRVIDLIVENEIPTSHEYMKIARGKYEYPNTLKKLWRKVVRKIKRIE